MRKLMLAAFAAMLVLALGAGTAAALRSVELGVASGTSVEARSRALTFTEERNEFSVICEVTLTITVNRAIAKTAGEVVGGVTGVTVANCRGGTVTVLAPEARRPWPAKYSSFTGTLPSITSVRLQLEGVGFLLSAFFGSARCLYGGNAFGNTAGNPVREIVAEEATAVPLRTDLRGIVRCPANGVFRGTFNLNRTLTMTLL